MNNKKNKKQRGGFVDMTDHMIIFGIISVICLIYGVLVYFNGSFNPKEWKYPMEWFSSETSEPQDLFRSDSAEPLGVQVGNTLQDLEKPIPKPVTNPDLFKTGGKLLKKFRRK